VSVDKIQGQWEALFGKDGSKEWIMKITLEGATEAAAKAKNMIEIIGGQWDGKKFQALIDADPTFALLAIKDPTAAAEYFVNKEWMAKLKALPKEAQDTLRQLTGMTEEEWNQGDFEAILEVAKNIPGLTEALLNINNGVKNPFMATFIAALNGGSLSYVQYQLDKLANPRFVTYKINYDDSARDAAMAGRGAANGAIMNGAGRGLHGFNPKYFANGGIERHVAQITKPGSPIRVWNERETFGEAYVPYAMSKRPRSVAILAQVAKDFGYTLNRSEQFANGGLAGNTTTAPSRTSQTSVTVGTINTVDPDGAVRKLRQLQHDALSVAGIN
jgi:hypothetical protein